MWPDLPNLHALVMLLVTVAALYLFSRENYRLEVTSIGLLSLLAVGFSLFPFEGLEPVGLFYGLGHEALISVCALLVLGQGIVVTGALEPVGRGVGARMGEDAVSLAARHPGRGRGVVRLCQQYAGGRAAAADPH